MAKKKNSSQKNLFLFAAAAALIFIIFTQSGQLTGDAVYNGTLSITVSDVETCAPYYGGSAHVEGATVSESMAAGTSNEVVGSTFYFINTGSVTMDVNLTTATASGSYCSQSAIDFVTSGTGSTAEEDLACTGADADNEVWNNVAGGSTQSGPGSFNTTVGSTEAAATYTMVFDFECDFSPQ